MKIILSPQRRDDSLEVSRQGSTLIVNGEAFDFARMASGDTLPAIAISSQWFADQVANVDGELELTLILPLPANYSQAQAYPLPLIDVPNGPVEFPLPLNEEETAAKFPRPIVEYETVPILKITDTNGNTFGVEVAPIKGGEE